jgi:hypothetical protein
MSPPKSTTEAAKTAPVYPDGAAADALALQPRALAMTRTLFVLAKPTPASCRTQSFVIRQ